MAQRLKVLISAYACEPNRGSEPGTSWEWCIHLAAHHDLTVVTRANQREGIEKEVAAIAGSRPVPRFVYLDAPRWVLWLKRRLPASQVWYYALWQRLAQRTVGRLVKTEPFDLVHHLSWATFRFHAAIWGHGLPSIWGPVAGAELCPWELLPWWYPQVFLAELVRNVATVVQTSVFSLLPARARRSTLTLVVSPDMQRAFDRHGIATQMLPTLAVHPPPAYERRKSSSTEPLRLLFVGRMMYWKGVELALRALHRSSTQATYTFAGEGPFLPHAKRLVRKLGLEKRVSFLGRVPYAAMVQAYRDSDALLFPSIHDSGSNVVVEAMSHAMPVICLHRGGPGLFVLHNETGMKINTNVFEDAVAGLANAIRTYDSRRELLTEHGAAARRHVEENFSWPKRALQMDALYREAVTTFRK